MSQSIHLPLPQSVVSETKNREILKQINELLQDKSYKLLSITEYEKTQPSETGLVFVFGVVDKGDDYQRIYLA